MQYFLILPAAVLLFIIVKLISSLKPFHVLVKDSHPEKQANAVLLNIEATGVVKNDRPEMLLQLQVKPLEEKSFVIEIKETMNHLELQHIIPGKMLRVRYNPVNHKKTMLVKNIG